MSRFVLPSVEELDQGVEDRLSENTKRNGEYSIRLLNDYKKEAFGWEESIDTLPNVKLILLLRSFMSGVRTKDGKCYEPNSLESFWYAIKRHLRSVRDINLDDEQFQVIKDQLKSVQKNLRKEGRGNLPNKSNDLTPEEVQLLFKRKTAGSHSPEALRNAIVLFSLLLGRRAATELRKTCFGDLKVIVINGMQHLTLDGTRISKSRQGETPRDIRHGVGMLSSQTDKEVCPVYLFLKYSSKRPVGFEGKDSPLFMTTNNHVSKDPRKSFEGEKWFKPQPCGVNTLGQTVQKMVKVAGLDVGERKVTNSSIRKMIVCALSEAGFSDNTIKAYTGHKSASSFIHYDNLNERKAKRVTNTLLNREEEPSVPLSQPPILVETQRSPKQISGKRKHRVPRTTSPVSLHVSKKRKNTDDQPVPPSTSFRSPGQVQIRKDDSVEVNVNSRSWSRDLVPSSSSDSDFEEGQLVAPYPSHLIQKTTDSSVSHQTNRNALSSIMGSHNVFSGNVVINFKNN